ncbi:MAG: threonine--tRNA ligase [Planctomycetota bacterium]
MAIAITLPDQSVKSIEKGQTAKDVAHLIGDRLANDALAAKFNNEFIDLSRPLTEDGTLEIITPKSGADALEILRHSAAHIMAEAIMKLWPDAKLVYGPTVKDGFYYDVELKSHAISIEDLPLIEAEMAKIIAADSPFERIELSRADALKRIQPESNRFKEDNVNRATGDIISFYRQGSFEDLCRGPHLPSTGKLTAFKLMTVSGSYWKGDVTGPVLQRIYGTAWQDPKALKQYIDRLEEAKRRDHRLIGKQLDLFHIQDEAPGEVFWHPKGWTLYKTIREFMGDVARARGYQEIFTPLLIDKSLWEKSGHWEKFREAMFITSAENHDLAVKPMNCPGHIQIYKRKVVSYKELPLRFAEFGLCHRYEPSGTMHGLMRVREFVQDDGHIFCMESQIQDEVLAFIQLVKDVYSAFGFENIIVFLATRPEKRVGSDAVWDKAEKALADALQAAGLPYGLHEGEGAFYGPKLEFSIPDALERIWQLGTIQVDFSMPARLGAEYVGEDNQRREPVMLHRACLGSLERFTGILIEHYAGKFPYWLAPVQARVASFSERQLDAAKELNAKLIAMGIRSELDIRNEKIGYKVREFETQKVPYLLVLGDREVESGTMSVRALGKQDLGAMTLDAFVAQLPKTPVLA